MIEGCDATRRFYNNAASISGSLVTYNTKMGAAATGPPPRHAIIAGAGHVIDQCNNNVEPYTMFPTTVVA